MFKKISKGSLHVNVFPPIKCNYYDVCGLIPTLHSLFKYHRRNSSVSGTKAYQKAMWFLKMQKGLFSSGLKKNIHSLCLTLQNHFSSDLQVKPANFQIRMKKSYNDGQEINICVHNILLRIRISSSVEFHISQRKFRYDDLGSCCLL